MTYNALLCGTAHAHMRAPIADNMEAEQHNQNCYKYTNIKKQKQCSVKNKFNRIIKFFLSSPTSGKFSYFTF